MGTVNGLGSSRAGFTLIEVLVAVLVLGIIVFGSTAQLSAPDPQRLELAASEVAAAIRFARSEAMRTGEVHAAFVDHTNDQIVVEKTDLSTVPASTAAILYHPIAKQPYVLVLPKRQATRGVILDKNKPPFKFSTDRQRVMFTAAGVPVYIDTATGSTEQLQSGKVKLALDDWSRKVVVHAITGRVTFE